MDGYSWLGMFGLLISGFILLYGIRRAKAYSVAQQGTALRSTGRETPQPTAASHAGDRAYIDALRTGDPEKIAKARLPELLTPELLFQGLNDLRGHTSALDMFIERMRQQFALHQYRQLTRSWVQYIEHMGISQDAFWRQVTDRFLVPLQQQKDASGLQADIAEQELREARAHYAREELNNPKIEPRKKSEEEVQAEQKATEEKRYANVVAAMNDRQVPSDTSERKLEYNKHQDRMRRIINGEPF